LVGCCSDRAIFQPHNLINNEFYKELIF
jgi:hypothetical protein